MSQSLGQERGGKRLFLSLLFPNCKELKVNTPKSSFKRAEFWSLQNLKILQNSIELIRLITYMIHILEVISTVYNIKIL